MKTKAKKIVKKGIKVGIKTTKFAAKKAKGALSILLKLGLLSAIEGKRVAKKIVKVAKTEIKKKNPVKKKGKRKKK